MVSYSPNIKLGIGNQVVKSPTPIKTFVPTVSKTKPLYTPPKDSYLQKPFFSAEGQAQRISSAFNTIGAATIGRSSAGKTKVVANTNNKAANKVLEVTSNNPFKTAAVIGTAAVAAPFVFGPSAAGGSSAAAISSMTAKTGASYGFKQGALLFGGGALAGLLYGAGKGGTQTTNPVQDTKQEQPTSTWIQPTQDSKQDTGDITPKIDTANTITGDGNSIFNTVYQNTYTTKYNYQLPSQSTPTSITPTQTAIPTQETTPTQETGGIDLLTLALIGAGAYVLLK